MNKKRLFIFCFVSFFYGQEELLWDLGVKIKKQEKIVLLDINQANEQKGQQLFNEIIGLSNKLKISQTIIDEENEKINEKIEPKPTLIFSENSTKEEKTNKQNAYQAGRYKDAIEYLNKINKTEITQSQKNKINYLKANAYFNLGEYKKSEEYLSYY